MFTWDPWERWSHPPFQNICLRLWFESVAVTPKAFKKNRKRRTTFSFKTLGLWCWQLCSGRLTIYDKVPFRRKGGQKKSNNYITGGVHICILLCCSILICFIFQMSLDYGFLKIIFWMSCYPLWYQEACYSFSSCIVLVLWTLLREAGTAVICAASSIVTRPRSLSFGTSKVWYSAKPNQNFRDSSVADHAKQLNHTTSVWLSSKGRAPVDLPFFVLQSNRDVIKICLAGIINLTFSSFISVLVTRALFGFYIRTRGWVFLAWPVPVTKHQASCT